MVQQIRSSYSNRHLKFSLIVAQGLAETGLPITIDREVGGCRPPGVIPIETIARQTAESHPAVRSINRDVPPFFEGSREERPQG